MSTLRFISRQAAWSVRELFQKKTGTPSIREEEAFEAAQLAARLAGLPATNAALFASDLGRMIAFGKKCLNSWSVPLNMLLLGKSDNAQHNSNIFYLVRLLNDSGTSERG